MTTERFRELIKRLHPDHNGGSNRFAAALTVVLRARARHTRSRFAKCSCGVTILARCKHCGTCSRKRAVALLATLAIAATPFKLMSPKESGEMRNAPMRLTALPNTVRLRWSYPVESTNVEFTVERAASVNGPWEVERVTTSTDIIVAKDGPEGYFRVSSHRKQL